MPEAADKRFSSEADEALPLKHSEQVLKDPTRPVYHLVSAWSRSHVADPNFAFFWKGRYHLFYISGKPTFAHVSSTDMVNWCYHRNANFGGLSGTMFLSTEGVPTIISRPDRQIALLTPLDDQLEEWEVLTTIKPSFTPGQDGSRIGPEYWDPDAWTEGDATYVLLGEYPLDAHQQAALLKSTDMKTWHFVDYFLPKDMPGVTRCQDTKTKDDLSCPNFFKIGNKWMLLCISHNKGCRYYLGNWKDERFTPEFHGWMNWSKGEVEREHRHGGDVFAPESLLTPDGRRVMWAWLFAQSTMRVSELWQEVMSLPRELSLPEDGVLRIKPLKELEQLRHDLVAEGNMTIGEGALHRLKSISGDTVELMVRIKRGSAKRYGVRVLCDKDNGKGLDVVVEPATQSLHLGDIIAPLELKSGNDIQLRIFIDHSVVEVFANERQAMAKQHTYEAGDVGVCLFSEGGEMAVSEIRGWQMKPAVVGAREAR